MKLRWRTVGEQALAARRPRPAELLAALDEVNPTPRERLDPAEREERYAMKGRLQTRLIERFPADLELRRDAEGLLLLALRGGRDAKHVVRDQLGERAQDWVGQELARLDAAGLPDAELSRDPVPLRRLRLTDDRDDPEDLVAAGEYDRATDAFGARARAGDAVAAVRCVELLLDFLDRPGDAVALVESTPLSVATHPDVAALHALALVRSGRCDAAEAVLRRCEGPSAGGAWRELGARRLEANDEVGARRAADRMEAVDRSLLAAAGALRASAAALVERRLGAELTALGAAVEHESWDEVERLVGLILAQDPRNRSAREAEAEVARHRTAAAADRSFDDGVRLERAGRWREAAARFQAAADGGRREAAGRSAALTAKAEAEEREGAVAGVLRALGDEPRRGLVQWSALDEAAAAEVRSRSSPGIVRLLDWFGPIASPRAEAGADAALALVAAADAHGGGRPDDALALLEPHVGVLERSKPARVLLAAAREAVEARERRRAQGLLDAATAAVHAGSGDAAARVSRVPVRSLDGEGRAKLAELERVIAGRALEATRVATFEQAIAADPLSALSMATRAEGEWPRRRLRAEEAVRQAWRVQDLLLDGDSFDLGTPEARGAPCVAVDPERQVAWMAETAAHWLALTEVELSTGVVRRGLALRLPDKWHDAEVHLVGATRVWVATLFSAVCIDLERGMPVARLGREDDFWRLSAGVDGVWWRAGTDRWRWRPTVGPERLVESEIRVVIGVPGRTEAVAQTRTGEIVTLTPDGKREHLVVLGSGGELVAACAHPSDPEGFVAVGFWPQEGRIDILCVHEHGSNLVSRRAGEWRRRTLAASRATGLLYALEPGYDDANLAGLTPAGALRFQVQVPSNAVLLTDPTGDTCLLAVEAVDGMRFVVLGTRAPELPVLPPRHSHGPRAGDCFANPPPELVPLVEELESGDGLEEYLDALLAEHPDDPVFRDRVLSALAYSWPGRAGALASRLGVDPRTVPALVLELADQTGEAQVYGPIEALLEGVDLTGLPSASQAHARHLRGAAALARGDLAAVRRHLEPARKEPGECPIDELFAWAEVVEASDPALPEPALAEVRSWWEIRRAMAEAASALASGEAAVAVRALSLPAAARCEQPEVVALRALALVQDATAPFWSRLRGLTRLWREVTDPPMPAGSEPPDRTGVREAAQAWLDGVAAVSRTARLLLAESDGSLTVRWAVAYGDAVPSGAPAVETFGRTVRRCLVWESQIEARFVRELGAGEVRFEGEDAFRFLEERLTALSTSWEVHAEHRLTRVVRASPIAHEASGKVSLGFGTDAGEVSADDAIRAWLAGRHYVRVDEGTVARLPATWMGRHAREAREAVDDEQAGDRGPAWELCRETWGIGVPTPPPPLPPGLRATLRPYQVDGFRWLARRRTAGVGALLADEMGLGKTVQAIACLLDAAHRGASGPFLVVAPASLLAGWREELSRFAPELGRRTTTHHGPGRPTAPYDGGYRVVLTTYETLRSDLDLLRSTSWAALVLDEAQRLRNPASQSATAVRALSATFRLAITGTPLENRVADLASIMECVAPGLLGPATLARLRSDASEELFAERVGRRAGPLLLRRRKAEVATDLPPVQEVVLPVDLRPEERELYTTLLVSARAELAEAVAAGRGGAIALTALTRLRQAACDATLLKLPGRAPGRSSKLEALAELVAGAVESGHGVLVFSSFTGLLDQAAETLRGRGVRALRLDGRTKLSERERVAREMGAPGRANVCLLTYGAGGVGLNLTGADHVVLLDPWWNPAVEGQAIDRAHRIGQLRPVLVHRMVAVGTVEDQVRTLAEDKRRVFHAAMDGVRAGSELLELLGRSSG